MITYNEKEVELMSDISWEMATKFYDMFNKCKNDWSQKLKIIGRTDDEILKEFIETAYWYGFVGGMKIQDNVSDNKN